MSFELLDAYLLSGSPEKAEIVRTLLAKRSDLPAAQPFYEGMRMLGARTPDLALLALRLVLAGKPAEDERVVSLRELSERARRGGDDGAAARDAYAQALA
jgi:hypothetical protein